MIVVVTGATGEFGRLIVKSLRKRVPGTQIGISVRDPEKAAVLRQHGIRVCKGDFAEPASLLPAFEGAEQVLIVSVNKMGDEAVRQHENAIGVAKHAGVKRILYTSHQGAHALSAFGPCRDHAATEALLESSRLPYVSLRNGFYAESALSQMGDIRETGKMALPEDGPVSWTARADLAEAAVTAIIQPGLFEGISPPLTNSQALDFGDIAKLATKLLGRRVIRETISDEDYRRRLILRGVPEVFAAGLGGLFRASRAREFAVVDSNLEGLLGRPPTTMNEVLTDFLGRPQTKSS